jgi:hypothetical protein
MIELPTGCYSRGLGVVKTWGSRRHYPLQRAGNWPADGCCHSDSGGVPRNLHADLAWNGTKGT